ncbi:MAG: hypothetical protein QM528_00280 [Phycisphaerales bacterium]|nr:hypothetical protein [Phycisphaerales bacterium]
MKLLSFDCEIDKMLPSEQVDFKNVIPTIVAICTNESDVQFFYDRPYLNKGTANKLVDIMLDYIKKGYFIFGHNVCYFDL